MGRLMTVHGQVLGPWHHGGTPSGARVEREACMGIEERLGYIASRRIYLETQAGVDYEMQQISLPHTATRTQVRKLLTEEAEYGHWELQRLRRYRDGSTTAWLRRKVIKVRSTLRGA